MLKCDVLWNVGDLWGVSRFCGFLSEICIVGYWCWCGKLYECFSRLCVCGVCFEIMMFCFWVDFV